MIDPDKKSPRRALVTGASGDLGSAIARRLAQAGHHVIVHANSRLSAAQALADALRAEGLSAEPVAFDVTDRAASAAAIEALLKDGPVQILVNNAGIHDDAVFPGLRPDQWDRVLDVSVNGFFNVTQPLTLPMLRTRWGRIVNIGSVAGITGNRGQVNYAAAKGALHSATKALSMELASRGVTVNAVAPGIIASAMADAVFDDKLIASLVPVKRAGRPDEVAALVGFLCGEEAGYISGQVVSINGGMA
ncbi:3-oxoacyl-ACP reductase FabG [Leptothrix discophora]|uniref:3-oxoacyl-ACP reductase FabG n=1 Tax=Leptothrix discophora TaxID=89 RepID=A0ABT9G8U3_LEPDI|nr:3-oxoacyl-ACP reductase FabG [Leptothrix discophora]MDP4302908.1 3-oxoacyl-ACP reductase FabG [Leptothrix discophora]